MTVIRLTQKIADKAEPREKRYDLRDTEITGLFLRIEPTGKRTFYVNYRTRRPVRRQRNVKIAPGFTPLREVRIAAQRFLSKLCLEDCDPAEFCISKLTLADLIKKYEPWVKKNRKSGTKTLHMLKRFTEFMHCSVSELTSDVITAWQKRQKTKGATVNRRLCTLQACLSWAVNQKLIPAVPFHVSKVSQKDSRVIERYLTPDEKKRLLEAAEHFEKKWMKPAIIVSMNTGIRKGTLLKLRWKNVDLEHRRLVLGGDIMKAGKDAVIPLNDAAYGELARLRGRGHDNGYVFTEHGRKLGDIQKQFVRLLKTAGIKNFTWHCLRHDFASQLVMAGVSIKIVQKLMCHSTASMTERYAHLAPGVLADAVAVLG